ncbi:Os04g0674900 [Oryza sativa Japonica Group]|uniref:Os04g0674900 protein n=1 Tax=Oryza sativa subsp. japonica TaxID=39947 RepID=A0A0N7KJX2_ORYSJ|nr:hypothetical protein EE612_026243 [Oryza sativa]BAS91609.1 Os04g0674900 [Oryza sativa Japonica Group]
MLLQSLTMGWITRGHLDVVAVVLLEAGAEEELGLGLILLQRVGVAGGAAALLEEDLGEEDLEAGVLVVPGELGDGPAGAAERLRVLGHVAEVLLVAGRLVQPRRRPQQLVLVAGRRRVELLGALQRVVVLAPERPHVSLYLLGVEEEEVGVHAVVGLEGLGGGGESGGGLAGDLRPGVVDVDLERRARRRHVLGALPAQVVAVACVRTWTQRALCWVWALTK